MDLVKAVLIGAVLIAGFIMLPVVIAAITVLADMRSWWGLLAHH